MTHEQFERELSYRAALSISKALLSQGYISTKDSVKLIQFSSKNTGLLWAVYARNYLDFTGFQRYHVL